MQTNVQPGDRYWSWIEPHFERISIYDGHATFVQQLRETPEPIAHLLCAHWCQSEVSNGGFGQFFANSTGVLGPEAAIGFERVGMTATASVVRSALAHFGEDYPRERGARDRALKKLGSTGAGASLWQRLFRRGSPAESNVFEPCDDQFFALVDTEAGGWDVAADRYAASHGG